MWVLYESLVGRTKSTTPPHSIRPLILPPPITQFDVFAGPCNEFTATYRASVGVYTRYIHHSSTFHAGLNTANPRKFAK